MKKYVLVLCCVMFTFFSCKEEEATPSPYNLNGLWEGTHTLVKTEGDNCPDEIKPDQFRMEWRVDQRDTVTVKEQEYSAFTKSWFIRDTQWRGAVTNDTNIRITKYYEGKCQVASRPDSVVFRGKVVLENGYLVLNLEGEELYCPSASPTATACTYTSRYQIRKKVEE